MEIKRIMKRHTRSELLRILNEVHPTNKSFPIDRAANLLRKFLDKPRQVKHVLSHLEDHGVSQTTMYRAARELGVKTKVTGFGKQKRSWWSL